MDASTGRRGTPAVVNGEKDMTVLRKELQIKEAEAFFAANAKELPKESFNRKILVAAHEQGRLAVEQELQGKRPLEKHVLVSSSVEAGVAPPLSKPVEELSLSSLKEIFLPQLEINKRHFGRVLFGTFCVQPFKVSSLISVLADKSGKAVRVSICNLSPSMSSKGIEARFATGSKVAMKEPYFKLCADGKVTVRVENPAEVVLVDDSNKEIVCELEAVLQELDKIRTEGNLLFAQRKWSGAIERYSACIARCNTVVGGGDNKKIKQCLLLAFSNRSEVWLQILNFKNALDDANKALEFDADHQKSISRRDRAWLGFGRMQTPVKGPVEDLFAGNLKRRVEKDVSKSKLRDATPPSPASRVKPTDPKDNPPPTVGKGTDSLLSCDVSKPKATGRKSISSSPNASKVKLIQSKDRRPGATSPPSKGKLPDAIADPLHASKEKVTSNCERKQAVTAVASGGPAPDSDSKEDSCLSGFSKTKSTDADENEPGENEPGSTVIDEQSVKLSGDPPPPRSFTGNVIGKKRVPPPVEMEELDEGKEVKEVEEVEQVEEVEEVEEANELEELDEMSARESENEAAGPVNCEGSSFASWLDSFRSAGDALLSQGKWIDAISKYDSVTEFNPTKNNRDRVIQTLLLAYSHRSEAWIWLGNYENSLKDANAALEFVDKHPQSVVGYDAKHLLNEVRRGRAFHGLGEYQKACSIFNAALAKSPNDKSISDFLQKSQICYQQSRDGVYDLDEYFLKGCSGPPPPCSDFVGPVEVRPILGKGRGLFVTRDVHAGDLLLVSNPLAVVRRRLNSRQGGVKDGDEDYSFLTTKWRRNSDGHPVGLDDFVGRLALLQSKRMRYQLYTLSVGAPEDETEIPDINVFIPGSQFEVPSGWKYLHTDRARLRDVVILNAIDGNLNPLDSVINKHDEGEEAIGCVGLWALPSFMNHSCIPNCHMIDVGNAMFVRASRNILEGEELTRAYFNVYVNGLDRQRICQEWRFSCNCERCDLEKALTAQRVLPLYEYRKLLDKVREESLKRLRFVEKDRPLSLLPLSLLPSPQPALLQLRRFADWFDRLLSREEGLGNKEKAWIGASHLEAYISRFAVKEDKKHFVLAVENVLEFMTNTAVLGMCQKKNALALAAQLLEMVEDVYGIGSHAYRRIETRVLDLYKTAYGSLRKEVLLTMSRLMCQKA